MVCSKCGVIVFLVLKAKLPQQTNVVLGCVWAGAYDVLAFLLCLPPSRRVVLHDRISVLEGEGEWNEQEASKKRPVGNAARVAGLVIKCTLSRPSKIRPSWIPEQSEQHREAVIIKHTSGTRGALLTTKYRAGKYLNRYVN